MVLAHGWNPGSIKKKDIASTIAAGVAKWWTLIGETDGVNRIGYIGGGTREHQSDTVYTTGGYPEL